MSNKSSIYIYNPDKSELPADVVEQIERQLIDLYGADGRVKDRKGIGFPLPATQWAVDWLKSVARLKDGMVMKYATDAEHYEKTHIHVSFNGSWHTVARVDSDELSDGKQEAIERGIARLSTWTREDDWCQSVANDCGWKARHIQEEIEDIVELSNVQLNGIYPTQP